VTSLGYWIGIERVKTDGQRHTYAYGREGSHEAHLTLDLDEGRLYPSDADGHRTSSAWVNVAATEDSRGDLPSDAWARFVEAAAGVIKRMRKEGRPPRVADRVYG
jgi:hypothetical protein